jgi:hypothetical protein
MPVLSLLRQGNQLASGARQVALLEREGPVPSFDRALAKHGLGLDLGLRPDLPQHIRDFDVEQLATRRIVTASHCYGCTAGTGPSCQGSVVPT